MALVAAQSRFEPGTFCIKLNAIIKIFGVLSVKIDYICFNYNKCRNSVDTYKEPKSISFWNQTNKENHHHIYITYCAQVIRVEINLICLRINSNLFELSKLPLIPSCSTAMWVLICVCMYLAVYVEACVLVLCVYVCPFVYVSIQKPWHQTHTHKRNFAAY